MRSSKLVADTAGNPSETGMGLHFSAGMTDHDLRPNAVFSTFILGGLRVHSITKNDLLTIISEAVEKEAKYIVANHNTHGLYLWYHDAKMRELHARANFVHVDGLPLIPLFRLFGLPLSRKHRTAYIEFLPLLCDQAVKRGWKIYYLGSKPGVVERGAEVLRAEHPGLQLRAHHGYFDTAGAHNDGVLADIRKYDPHVLLVGMGMPRQEAWISENYNQISARTIFCAGCTMDYVAQAIPSCPRWLGNSGFEWLYRLFTEPTRLWKRYLVEPWSVLAHMIQARFKVGSTTGRELETSSTDSLAEDMDAHDCRPHNGPSRLCGVQPKRLGTKEAETTPRTALIPETIHAGSSKTWSDADSPDRSPDP